jgi:hypothetical protein
MRRRQRSSVAPVPAAQRSFISLENDEPSMWIIFESWPPSSTTVRARGRRFRTALATAWTSCTYVPPSRSASGAPAEPVMQSGFSGLTAASMLCAFARTRP